MVYCGKQQPGHRDDPQLASLSLRLHMLSCEVRSLAAPHNLDIDMSQCPSTKSRRFLSFSRLRDTCLPLAF